jgi:hypothetical protein
MEPLTGQLTMEFAGHIGSTAPLTRIAGTRRYVFVGWFSDVFGAFAYVVRRNCRSSQRWAGVHTPGSVFVSWWITRDCCIVMPALLSHAKTPTLSLEPQAVTFSLASFGTVRLLAVPVLETLTSTSIPFAHPHRGLSR